MHKVGVKDPVMQITQISFKILSVTPLLSYLEKNNLLLEFKNKQFLHDIMSSIRKLHAGLKVVRTTIVFL